MYTVPITRAALTNVTFIFMEYRDRNATEKWDRERVHSIHKLCRNRNGVKVQGVDKSRSTDVGYYLRTETDSNIRNVVSNKN
jgi:hypothetical protein